MAVGVVPNVRPVVIGAIHFAILGPVLGSFCFPLLGETIPPLAWWVGLLAVTILTVPLVVQGMGGGPWTSTASASGGTLVAMWWSVVLATLVRREGPSRPQT